MAMAFNFEDWLNAVDFASEEARTKFGAWLRNADCTTRGALLGLDVDKDTPEEFLRGWKTALRTSIATLQAEAAPAAAAPATVINEDALVERIIAGLNLRALDPLPDIEKVIRATSVIHIKNARGNAVAITPTLALTALHDVGQVDAIVSLTTTIGGHRLPGIVVYHEFVADLVDIAVIELTTEGDVFPDCVDVLFDGIKLCDPLFVVGLKTGLRDAVSKVVFRCDVNMIEGDDGGNSAMFQTNYASFEGLSGAGVVTRVVNGVTKVVGVHVASHDETVKHPEIGKSGKKRLFASAESVDLALTSIASNIHGHHAFCLACEVARVPDLVTFLHERGVR